MNRLVDALIRRHLGLTATASMATSGGGEPSPPPSTIDSFRKLMATQGKNLPPASPPSFVKKLDSIPEIDLPLDHPMRVAVSLLDHGLVGQFMGL
jgi:hypothetical protein